ncbi:MAG TPA: hypothetical protein VKA68_17075 [bacterium]|nr:hypothetical protein [bacterium]
MSLLKELQHITERTYQQGSGINLEKFVIGRQRFWDLHRQSAETSRELSDIARTFFRVTGNRLYLAIYYSDQMIKSLERHDPRRGVNEKNIFPFIVFIEELNHAIHGALKFLSGERNLQREDFIRDLELLSKIDSYFTLKFFVAYFNRSKQLEQWDRLWLRHHLFEQWDYDYTDHSLRDRYLETNTLGEKYTRFLDGLESRQRVTEIRKFRGMTYPRKRQYILMLP